MLLLATTFGATLAFAPTAAAAKLDYASGMVVRAPSCDAGCHAGHFTFDVQSTKNGLNPSGYVAVNFPGQSSLTGIVTCLKVQGANATILGRIMAGTGDMNPALYTDTVYFVFKVHNGGKARGGRPGPDQISHIEWDTANNWKAQFGLELADICADPTDVLTTTQMFRLIGGDLTVVDK